LDDERHRCADTCSAAALGSSTVTTTEELLPLLDESGSVLYHYTRLAVAIEEILPTGRMIMNPLALMRDPRESKELRPEAHAEAEVTWKPENITRFASVLQKSSDVKQRVKVLSLTEDDRGQPSIFARVSLTQGSGSSTRRSIRGSASALTASD
jgi:hypothetical protein